MRITIIPPKSVQAKFDIEEAMKYLEKKAEKMKGIAVEKAPQAKAPYIEYRGGKGIKRRPGRLKKNIKKKDMGNSVKVYVDNTQKGAPYGLYQEVGFVHWKTGKAIPGKFYFETAFDIVMLDIQRDKVEVAKKCLKLQASGGHTLVKIR